VCKLGIKDLGKLVNWLCHLIVATFASTGEAICAVSRNVV
jgi:hypothetical protein